MKRIYSILVENRAGVLCKTAGLFWRRCFNIDSITVGETDDKEVSSMVIVSSGDERTLEQIEKQLNKKLDVIKVKTFDESESINRELLLVKVKYNRGNRRDIMDNCQIMGARIVDMSRNLESLHLPRHPQVCQHRRDHPDRCPGYDQMRRARGVRHPFMAAAGFENG